MKQRMTRQAPECATRRMGIAIALIVSITLALVALPGGSPRAVAVDDGTSATPVPGEAPRVIDPTSTLQSDSGPANPTESAHTPTGAGDSRAAARPIDPTIVPTFDPTIVATSPPRKPPRQTGGAVNIDPNRKQSGDPGATVIYQHMVENLGSRPDVIDLLASSSRGWTVAIYSPNGGSLLPDHDGDGLPDTGPLAPGERRVISLLVTIPETAHARITDVTTVTARSSIDPTGTRAADSVKDSTTINQILSLVVNTDTVDFGAVSAGGAVDPSAPGVISAVDDQGAYYLMPQAVQVTVVSNDSWRGTCQASENTGGSPTVLVGDGRLEWRLAGTDTWVPFSTRRSTTCFPSPPIAGGTFIYDIRLRVETSDQPGTFRSVVTFSATS